MNIIRRASAGAALAVTMLALTSAVVLAHGHRDVGEYSFTVGFFVEPAFEGQKNGVDLRISLDGEPVEGVEQSLEVEVTQGDASITLPLRTVFNDPGRYTADFFPTAAGAYTFRFFGTVGDLAVDESFTSEVDNFSAVNPVADLQFPVQIASDRELQAAITGNTEAATSAESTADDAASRAMIGIALGAVGALAGGAALVLSLTRRS